MHSWLINVLFDSIRLSPFCHFHGSARITMVGLSIFCHWFQNPFQNEMYKSGVRKFQISKFTLDSAADFYHHCRIKMPKFWFLEPDGQMKPAVLHSMYTCISCCHHSSHKKEKEMISFIYSFSSAFGILFRNALRLGLKTIFWANFDMMSWWSVVMSWWSVKWVL